MVLNDIRDIITERVHTDRIGSSELAATLGSMEGRPWAEWRNGKPIRPAALARLLAPFGIVPRTFKGYLRGDFDEAFAVYLGDQTVTPSQLNNDGDCDGLQSVTTDADVTASKASQPNNDELCDGVTVSRRGKGPGNGVPERWCDHCGRTAGDLQETYYGEASAILHRDCQDAWRAALDKAETAPTLNGTLLAIREARRCLEELVMLLNSTVPSLPE
jgi:hypothetical protein